RGYAVELAKVAGALVIATASVENDSYVRRLGADGVIDYRVRRFEERVKEIDAGFDRGGGETLDPSFGFFIRWAVKPWTALMGFLSAAASSCPQQAGPQRKKPSTMVSARSSSSFK